MGFPFKEFSVHYIKFYFHIFKFDGIIHTYYSDFDITTEEETLEEKTLLLLGDEAVAQGALDAGISGFYAYPGTPSTEIMEFAQHSKQAAEGSVHRTWSANEKTAVETAI